MEEEKKHILYTNTVYQSTRAMHALLTQYTLGVYPGTQPACAARHLTGQSSTLVHRFSVRS